MAHHCRAMPLLHVGYRVLPRPHAIEKISHVVVAHLEARRVIRQGSCVYLLLACVQVSAIHPDPAICPGEPNSVPLSFWIDDPAERRVGCCCLNDLANSLPPDERRLKFLA